VDNAELLRMIRKINGDVWLLLSCIIGLLFLILSHEKDDGRDKEWIYSRLGRLELAREHRQQPRPAEHDTAAKAADTPPPPRKAAAHKAAH
jgi:hypothetical protein